MDEVLKNELHYQKSTDVLTRRLSQPTEDIILERNKKLRNNAGAMHDLGAQGKEGSWGRQVASVPFILYDWAIRNGYELNSPDAEHAGKEMHRFLQSERGKACMIVEQIKR